MQLALLGAFVSWGLERSELLGDDVERLPIALTEEVSSFGAALNETDVVMPLAIELLPIDELRPDASNPRRISDAELEALTRSIREFGLVDPILARREDRVVIGGHQRLLAAR